MILSSINTNIISISQTTNVNNLIAPQYYIPAPCSVNRDDKFNCSPTCDSFLCPADRTFPTTVQYSSDQANTSSGLREPNSIYNNNSEFQFSVNQDGGNTADSASDDCLKYIKFNACSLCNKLPSLYHLLTSTVMILLPSRRHGIGQSTDGLLDPSGHYKITRKDQLTLRTSEAGIPALRELPYGVGSRYTGGTVCQRQAPEVSIPAARYVNARRQKSVYRLCFLMRTGTGMPEL